jgi:branched-chain amino acid transport system permease protein
MDSSVVFGQSLANGLLMGGVYALIAVGLTIIFGVMKMINFAQGEFLMLGMYASWFLYSITKASPYFLILPVAVIMFVIGLLVFRITIKPIMGRDKTQFVVLTMGLAFVLVSLMQLIFGTSYQSISIPIKNKALALGPVALTLPRLIACGIMLVLVFLVNLFLKATDLGRAMRATAENTAVAKMLGINTDKIFYIAFALGIMLAGLAGLLLTPIYYIYPKVGDPFKTIAMVVIVLGGLGDIRGAMIGGFIAGVVESILAQYVAFDFAPAGVYIILLLVLLFKPEGIFGKGARKA